MKTNAFLITALVLLANILAQAQDKCSDTTVLKYLKEVEWPKAYQQQDTTLLNRILAESYQRIDANGNISTKQEEMAYIKQHKPSYTSFRFQITRLEIFHGYAAIISGTGHAVGKDKDGDYTMTYQSSNFFIKQGDLWKAVASHISGIVKNKL